MTGVTASCVKSERSSVEEKRRIVEGTLESGIETPDLRSPHAPAPPIHLLPTSVWQSAVSALPTIAARLVPAGQPPPPKCPRSPQVHTSGIAHFGNHPHLPTLRPDGLRMTLRL